MQPVVQAVLLSWSIPPAATFTLALTALMYLRGSWLLRRAGYPNLPAWRIASFMLGLSVLWFALASPLDTFSSFVLTAHMLQHMLLMMVAPPLLLLGEPLIPILRGMPRFAAREFAGPFLNWRIAKRVGLLLTHPVTALVLMGTVMFVWHVPEPYELAVRSGAWHQFEHGCFFFASIIFWWPVVQPWPSRTQWPRWAMVPYLVIADLQNTALSAVLVFSDRLLYPSYGAGPSLFGFPAQEDQAASGAIMWVVGSLAFLVPAALITIRSLSRRQAAVLIDRSVSQNTVDVGGLEMPAKSGPVGIRFKSKTLEAVSFVALFVAVSVGFILLARTAPDDDDQVFRGSQNAGPFLVALYGPEGKVPLGPSTFAILVQDGSNHTILLNSEVRLSLRGSGEAAAPAKSVAAPVGDENKLLFTADIDVEAVGRSTLAVAVNHDSGRATASFPIDTVKPEAERSLPWPYIVMPVIAFVLAAAYLFRHRTGRPASVPTLTS